MKRSLIAFLLIWPTLCAFGLPDTSLTYEKQQDRLDLDITGLYLQPGANNLIYAVHTASLPITTPNWTQEYVSPRYNPAFEIALNYLLNNPLNQITVDWLYLNSSDTDSIDATGIATIAPPYYFGPFAQALQGSHADSTAKFTVSNVDVELNHLFKLNDAWSVNVIGGLTVAYLKEKLISNYAGPSGGGLGPPPSPNPFAISSFNTSTYLGVGPKLGFQSRLLSPKGYGLFLNLATALLVGSVKSETTFNSFGVNNTTPVNTSLADIRQINFVPELTGRIGANHLISYANRQNMNLEIGYVFTTFLYGITQVVPTSLVPFAFNGGVIAVGTSAQEQSSLNLNGPYLKVKYLYF